MADKINMPAGAGGLMRYGEEYKSKIMLKPEYVVIFIIAVILFVAVLKIFFPLG